MYQRDINLQSDGSAIKIESKHQGCWICDKWVYSLVFINPSKQLTLGETESFQNKQICQHVNDQLKRKGVYNSYSDPNKDNIYLKATFTNWKSLKMHFLPDFIELVDNEKPDIFGLLKRHQQIREEVETIQDLNEQELHYYNIELNEYRTDLPKLW